MAMTPVHDDFKEFLRLLNEANVEYLIVGGYAVAHHGYVRPTQDLDIWVAIHPDNARKLIEILAAFIGATVDASKLLQADQIFRMGRAPVRLELFTSITGVEFAECYARKSVAELDGVPADFIGLDDLREAKKASGRLKDLADLEELPGD